MEITSGGIQLPILLAIVLSASFFVFISVFVSEMERKMEKTLGQKIREYRLKRGMTQEELADKLLSKKSTVSDYENDKIDMKISLLREIVKILGVPLSHFLCEQDGDIDGEVMQMAMALKQIKSKELRKVAIKQVMILAEME